MEQLEKRRLLCSAARPNDWNNWLESAGAHIELKNKLIFENSSLACEGALMDLGIAIANRHFVQRQLHAGTLVIPIDHGCHTGESYYLTWPKGRSPSRPLLNFLDWIRTQIADPSDHGVTSASQKEPQGTLRSGEQ